MAEADPGILSAIDEIRVSGPDDLDAALRIAKAPFVVRGLVRDWPLVQAGLRSAREARDYILSKARPRPFTVSAGAPGARERAPRGEGRAAPDLSRLDRPARVFRRAPRGQPCAARRSPGPRQHLDGYPPPHRRAQRLSGQSRLRRRRQPPLQPLPAPPTPPP